MTKKLIGSLALALALALTAMPLSASAQHPKGGGGAGAKGGGAPAHVGAPAGHGASGMRGAGPSAGFRASTAHRGTASRATTSHRGKGVASHKVGSATKAHLRTQNKRAERRAHLKEQRQAKTQKHDGVRHNGKPHVTAKAARQGRFAAKAHPGQRHWHDARWAWRHRLIAVFVPWYGPIFWPYAYSDIFFFTFWPYGYDYGFWAFAYDDFFDGVFWGEVGPPVAYASAAPAHAPRPAYASVQELCKQPGSGITAWPFADIEQKVGLNDEQKQSLGDMRKAADEAAALFKASCPADDAFPLTPPGRLQAMTARLQATLQAVQTVRPALEKFYASLSDEQKERFNSIGPKRSATNAQASQALPQQAQSCAEPKSGLTNLPIDRIDDAVKPTDAQVNEIKQLEDATNKAVSILQAACPEDIPVTPTGRLEAMEKRLQAMIEAANTVKPALDSFYSSLSDEQKARFNRIGGELARSGS